MFFRFTDMASSSFPVLNIPPIEMSRYLAITLMATQYGGDEVVQNGFKNLDVANPFQSARACTRQDFERIGKANYYDE